MAANLPPPTPPDPNAGSSWKASDILYVAASGLGLLGSIVVTAMGRPDLVIVTGPVATFLFWGATYAGNKGD